jgi:putative ABC transport system permease protein
MALAVAQRRREMGIRIALGAEAREVAALVLRKGLRLAVIGLLFGLPAGFAITRALGSIVEGVEPFELRIYFASSALLAVAALLACALPAIRAARVPPALALQAE